MSNNFPVVPNDLELQGVSYFIQAPTPGSYNMNSDFSGTGFSGSATSIVFNAGTTSFQFTFSTPGSFGSFDQTTEESYIQSIAGDYAQSIATLTGQDLAAVKASMSIIRGWTWTNPAGYNLSWQESLPVS